MSEWVLKGSLKGPQGDPGQDAQLPAGGTTGQVLTKTADGEAWQDAPVSVYYVANGEDCSSRTYLSVGDRLYPEDFLYPSAPSEGEVDGSVIVVNQFGSVAKAFADGSRFRVTQTYNTSHSTDTVSALMFAVDTSSGDEVVQIEDGAGFAVRRISIPYASGEETDAEIRIGDGAVLGSGEIASGGQYYSKFSLSPGKYVYYITDAIVDSPIGEALVTDKAVADYVAEHGSSIETPVPISQGGTGATTADGARTALGISVADPTELVEYVKSKLGGA